MTALELAELRATVEDQLRHLLWVHVLLYHDPVLQDCCTCVLRALIDLDAAIALGQKLLAQRAQSDGSDLAS